MSVTFAAPLDNMAVDPMRGFSTRVEKRPVLDETGQVVGEDHRDYLSTGERWRKLNFRGRVTVKYGLVSESEAQLGPKSSTQPVYSQPRKAHTIRLSTA